ncbi:alternative ribosome rescue aminoacyl-tRNA hydrolase ArfB [Desulfoluna spongiiphila]|uniref:alternative ribosome rescue aminoacyl-tRNA hydrolase ArfB n=1 Tax=Desulfoluna spongiiphila TaxID=419481 RepID=UPI00125B0A36|nr:alternative ribosome rescue aminoacyl-tRNA hydrolase ArfB [Desulfoluna spongiiphila]VVS93454.1 peptide chain release factor class i/class ii [Desulfoluna spongiiphila]
MPIIISQQLSLGDDEVEISAVKASGPGGQHVNTSATAIHLRFDIRASSLPEVYKERLLAITDHRITDEGIVIIKSREHRSREMNRQAALERLISLIRSVTKAPKKRRPTRPSKNARERRLKAKTQRGDLKKTRGKVSH